ncbi:hypothetical protein TNCV_1666841 [Trichonephila clavipes]|nr:hypothetical protein TNCV_1666841 [Trichonephila clavipes]
MPPNHATWTLSIFCIPPVCAGVKPANCTRVPVSRIGLCRGSKSSGLSGMEVWVPTERSSSSLDQKVRR